MPIGWADTETVVSKLTLKGKRLDTLTASQRLTRLLQSVDLQPPGFPRDAILCIRRCRTQIPASWIVQSHVTAPSHEWQQRLHRSIEQLLQRAGRPAVETVSPTAEAVWFANRAELLACVAKDWRDGTLLSRWWWQSLFPQRDYSALFLRAWQESPEYIPSALHLLARMEQLLSVMRQLETHEAGMLRREVERAFGLTHLTGEFSLEPTEVTAETSRSEITRYSLWHSTVPELLSGRLGIEQEQFVGVGLMLHRAPSVVRSIAFARHYHQHYRAIAEIREVHSSDGIVPSTPRKPSIQFLNEATPDASFSEPSVTSTSTPTEDFNQRRSLSQRSRQTRDRGEPVIGQSSVEQRRSTSFTPKCETPINQQLWTQSEAQTLESEYGGVFYLINVGLFLELYGDFTQPLRPGLSLPIWDFLALVGERLVGSALREDPLWPLLSQLAGRELSQPPGSTFDPPAEWRVPPEWLRPFPGTEPWRWAWAEGRLSVWHSSDFLLLDCAMEGEPSPEAVRMLLQNYRQDGELVRIDDLSSRQVVEPLDQWLVWLLPYLRARITRALACDEADDWPALLFNHRATIAYTDTKLDVTFSLNQHPLAIRIAGLDRDPGWVPAAGRFIAFHYQVSS